MVAICKVDYGQFECNKKYNYKYTFQGNVIKYFVVGEYSESEFTKKQFESIFLFSKKNDYICKNKY